jgi:hypothetical protein
MKYSILAIDHILKKFQIVITKDAVSKKYGKIDYGISNSKQTMYDYYTDIEKEQDKYFTQSAFKRTTTVKQVPMYVKYNNRDLSTQFSNKSKYIGKIGYNTGISAIQTISKTPEYATKVGISAVDTISKTPQYLGKVRNSALKSISEKGSTIYKKFVPKSDTFRNIIYRRKV